MAVYTQEEKTAILLIAFGQELAGEVLKSLNPQEIRKITQVMSRLGKVEQEAVDKVVLEFSDLMAKNATYIIGDETKVQKILKKAHIDPFATSGRLTALDLVDGATIASIIKGEHPQTMALILAHLNKQKSGEVLKLLPPALHTEMVERMARLDKVSSEVLADLNESLMQRVEKMSIHGKSKLGGSKSVADMLASMDPQSAKKIMSELEAKDPDLALSVRSQMFVFEDISKLSDRDIQEILKKVSQDLLRVALRKASVTVQEKFFGNMSARAAETLKEDIKASAKMRMEDVVKAQDNILQVILKMEEDGVINISGEKLV
jgi:flagellar motor switch protein FliG